MTRSSVERLLTTRDTKQAMNVTVGNAFSMGMTKSLPHNGLTHGHLLSLSVMDRVPYLEGDIQTQVIVMLIVGFNINVPHNVVIHHEYANPCN